MHIPDGWIPLWQAAIYWIAALPFIVLSLRWARKEMDDLQIPLIAVLAAGIFAIQAVNIPIPWGTSGHVVGAALAAIILGSPWAGVLVLTLVVLVQGVMFADGGITAMGANILNMAVISGFVGYYAYAGVKKTGLSSLIAAFAGAWLGLFVSSIACAVEMGLAGVFPMMEGIMMMAGYHAIIGVVAEGLVTAIVLKMVIDARPDILPGEVAA